MLLSDIETITIDDILDAYGIDRSAGVPVGGENTGLAFASARDVTGGIIPVWDHDFYPVQSKGFAFTLTLDENGEFVKPEVPNAYKFETLILDMVFLMDNCLSFEVDREKEFAPVKNATGVDSVESARVLLQKNGIEI